MLFGLFTWQKRVTKNWAAKREGRLAVKGSVMCDAFPSHLLFAHLIIYLSWKNM